ncbi:DNA polymerase beta, partial [Ophiophagus hannah]
MVCLNVMKAASVISKNPSKIKDGIETKKLDTVGAKIIEGKFVALIKLLLRNLGIKIMIKCYHIAEWKQMHVTKITKTATDEGFAHFVRLYETFTVGIKFQQTDSAEGKAHPVGKYELCDRYLKGYIQESLLNAVRQFPNYGYEKTLISKGCFSAPSNDYFKTVWAMSVKRHEKAGNPQGPIATLLVTDDNGSKSINEADATGNHMAKLPVGNITEDRTYLILYSQKSSSRVVLLPNRCMKKTGI